jgi:hypothetical protein
MSRRLWLVVSVAGAVAVVLGTSPGLSLRAQSQTDQSALTGTVASAEEGAMEGVLVSVKRTGSTLTTTVVTDKEGRFRFPRTRLEAGSYAVSSPRDRLRPGKRAVCVRVRDECDDGGSEAEKDERPGRATDKRGMAGQFSQALTTRKPRCVAARTATC